MGRRITALAMLGLWGAAMPASPVFAGDTARGAELARNSNAAGVLSCSGCHGAAGEGQAQIGIPRLAALNGTYLDHQLTAFGNGTRDNVVMTPIAKRLDPAARADLAAYYAGLATPAATVPPAPRDVAAGEALALRGDWIANLPPCASCHGLHGLGVGANFPAIAGQAASYIAGQLRDWKSGARRDDPLGLMRSVAGHLGESQITAFATYYASLPATPPRRRSINESGQ